MNYFNNLEEVKTIGQIQPNSLINADCLEAMKYIADKSIDMILCDLPYGTTACKWDAIIPFEPLWEQYKRIIKDNGAIVLTASQPFTSALVTSNIKWFRYEWIWQKNTTSGFALAKKQPMKNHENILVFYKKQPAYNWIKEPRDMSEKSKKRMNYEFSSTKGENQINNGVRKVKFIPESKNFCYPKTVQKINSIVNNNKERFHPTQKPVALFEYLIKTYTNKGEIVLDNCSGSGTTAIAAINTKREYILIEKDNGYCEMTKKRISEHLFKNIEFQMLKNTQIQKAKDNGILKFFQEIKK